jgi:hypothetical protein
MDMYTQLKSCSFKQTCFDRMIILADEALEVFFDHEFAQSFQLTEMPIERQNSLSREIFDSLFAAGTRLATGRGKRRGLSRSSSKTPSTTTLSSMASVTNTPGAADSQIGVADADMSVAQAEANGVQESPKSEIESKVSEEEEEEEDDDEEDGEDVLEEVDRLLNEFEKS